MGRWEANADVLVGDNEAACFSSFLCRPVMVTWVRVDDEMPQHAVLSGPNLFISNLNKTDNGTYRCEASNIVGKAHSDYMLYVYGTWQAKTVFY